MRRVDPGDPLLRAALKLAGAAAAYHQARLEGAARLPTGPALLVGNHGLFGLETPVFFYLLHRSSGRFPIGLADRVVFGARPIRALLERVGGVPGTLQNGLEQLAAGALVVCYPGGSREVFKGQDEKYRLRWEKGCGFARLAIRAQVPIIPFAAVGVDDSFLHLGHPPLARRMLGRYAMPLAFGPLPVPFTFHLGRILAPPRTEASCEALKETTRREVEHLLEEHGRPALDPIPALS